MAIDREDTLVGIVNLLGGKKVFREMPHDRLELSDRVAEGLPFKAVEALAGALGIPLKIIVEMITASPKTAYRRIKDHGEFGPDEADRLMRIARIFSEAIRVFGRPEKAALWLKTKLNIFKDRSPLEILVSDVGSKEVEIILGRIEHGIY